MRGGGEWFFLLSFFLHIHAYNVIFDALVYIFI